MILFYKGESIANVYKKIFKDILNKYFLEQMCEGTPGNVLTAVFHAY